MKSGIELIAEERKEQIEKHGRTVQQDVLWNNKVQLHHAALSLLSIKDGDVDGLNHAFKSLIPEGWDKYIWEKMCNKTDYDRKIIAASLIAADIDRIQNT